MPTASVLELFSCVRKLFPIQTFISSRQSVSYDDEGWGCSSCFNVKLCVISVATEGNFMAADDLAKGWKVTGKEDGAKD